MERPSPAPIPTNMRLLVVLEHVVETRGSVTPTQVNEALGLPKPTIHRLFSTLEAEGFIQRDIDGRGYIPAPRLQRLGSHILSSSHLRTARQVILRKLSDQIGETCNISVPDGDAMMYSERVETAWPLRIQLPTGTRVPLYCTASGKLYLSSLPKAHLTAYLKAADLAPRTGHTVTSIAELSKELQAIEHHGYALDNEEFMQDMVAIAVPILDPHGRLSATLSCHAPTQRMDAQSLLNHLPQLNDCAMQISAMLHEGAA